MSKGGLMFGKMAMRWKRREVAAANISHPVLANYHRRIVSRREKKLLITGFFFLSFIFGFFFSILPTFMKPMVVAPLFVMAALIIWILPETGKPPTRLLMRVFFCYFVALVLWPYYLAIQIPGAPLIEIRRIFLLLSVLFLLVCLSVSKAFINDMKAILSTLPFFLKVFLAFIAVQALSLIGTPYFSQAFSIFLRNQLAWNCIFLVACYVLSRPGNILTFANLIRGSATILAIMAILEYRNQGVLWANHIPSFLQVSDPAMLRLLTPALRAGEYRVTGPFSVSLCLSEFLALTLPFFLQYLVVGKNRTYKAVLLVCDILVINAILLTKARVGVVGIIVTHGIYGFIWSIRYWRAHRDSLLGPMLALSYPVGLVLLASAMIFVERLRSIWLGGEEETASNMGRIDQLLQMPAHFILRPLFGYGPSQGGAVLNYRNPAGELSIDSSLVSIPLDYGGVGFVLYCTMFIYMLITGMRMAFDAREEEASYAMPVSVTIAAWLASRIVLSQEDNASFMYMMLGALVALAYQSKKQGHGPLHLKG